MNVYQRKSKIAAMLLYLYLIEVFLGGGGRIFSIGNITLRKSLFVIAIIYYFLHIIQRKTETKNSVGIWGIILFTYCCVSSFIGMSKGHSLYAVKSDLQPVIYLLIFFPVLELQKYVNIENKKIIELLKISALITAIFTLVMFAYEKGLGISAYDLREILTKYLPQNEFGVRKNGAIFLVAHFYVVVAAVFTFSEILYYKSDKKSIVFLIIYILAILQSSTRSTIVTMILAMGFLVLKRCCLYRRMLKKNGIVFILMAFVAIICIFPFIDIGRFVNLSDKSTSVRIDFIRESIPLLKESFILGKGYGVELLSKGTAHLECSYLEILLEQGAIGIIIWGIFIEEQFKIWKKIRVEQKNEFIKYASVALLIAVVLISFFNPYINNPVGISAFCILSLLNENLKNENFIKEFKTR